MDIRKINPKGRKINKISADKIKLFESVCLRSQMNQDSAFHSLPKNKRVISVPWKDNTQINSKEATSNLKIRFKSKLHQFNIFLESRPNSWLKRRQPRTMVKFPWKVQHNLAMLPTGDFYNEIFKNELEVWATLRDPKQIASNDKPLKSKLVRSEIFNLILERQKHPKKILLLHSMSHRNMIGLSRCKPTVSSMMTAN